MTLSSCDPSRLSAYLDGELDAAAREQVESHLAACPSCSAELESLRSVSSAVASYRFDDLRPEELARLHQAIDNSMIEVDPAIWRLGGTLGLIAASILVVAGTWLAVLPASRPGQQSQQTTVATADVPAWERTAMTLNVEHVRQADDPIYLADAQLDDWMLNALKTGPQQ